jgi:tRNA A37 threonylcarbamoyltransferase TsaD
VTADGFDHLATLADEAADFAAATDQPLLAAALRLGSQAARTLAVRERDDLLDEPWARIA